MAPMNRLYYGPRIRRSISPATPTNLSRTEQDPAPEAHVHVEDYIIAARRADRPPASRTAMTYERGVWYDFSQDRRRPLASRVVWLERDADAVLWRELRLAEMHADIDTARAHAHTTPSVRLWARP